MSGVEPDPGSPAAAALAAFRVLQVLHPGPWQYDDGVEWHPSHGNEPEPEPVQVRPAVLLDANGKIVMDAQFVDEALLSFVQAAFEEMDVKYPRRDPPGSDQEQENDIPF